MVSRNKCKVVVSPKSRRVLSWQMYREDSTSGLIHLAFSRDSTCDNMLASPIEG